MKSDQLRSAKMPTVIRELGRMERLMTHTYRENGSLVQTLFIISKEPVTTELIRGALLRLVVKIPCLKLAIIDHIFESGAGPVPAFVEVPGVQIPLETKSETDWIRQLSTEWNRRYNLSEGPLWRVVHLPNAVIDKKNEEFPYETVIIFEFHHVIIDGMSYQRLFGEFLNCLEAVSRGEMTDPEPGTVSLPMEHYLPVVPRWKRVMVESIAKFMLVSGIAKWLLSKRSNAYLRKFKLPIEENPGTPIETCMLPLEFSTYETSAIRQGCKANGVTVNGAVSAAATIACAQILEEEVVSKKISVDTYTAFNVRRLSKSIQKAFGMFSYMLSLPASVQTNAAYDSQAFWQLAKFFTEKVLDWIKKENYSVEQIGLGVFLSLLESGRASIQDLITEPYGRSHESLMLTNMGYCDFLDSSPESKFKLVGRFGGDCDHNLGCILTNNLNTFNGQMFWSVIFSKHIVPAARAEQYAKYVRQNLLRFTLPDTEL